MYKLLFECHLLLFKYTKEKYYSVNRNSMKRNFRFFVVGCLVLCVGAVFYFSILHSKLSLIMSPRPAGAIFNGFVTVYMILNATELNGMFQR